MRTTSMRRWALSATAAAAVVTGMVASTAGTASAAVQPSYAHTFTTKAGAYFWPHDGSPRQYLGAGVQIEVTCWYIGTPVHGGDAYQDHIDRLRGKPVSGHVVDYYVNLGGHTPPQVGIPECPPS